MPDEKLEAASTVSLAEMWRLGGLSLIELLKRTFRERRLNRLDARSAQFAYYSMLAVAPLLILVIASATALPLEGVLENSLRAASAAMPENAVRLIRRQIDDIQQHTTWGLVALATVLMAVAGSRVILTLGHGLDDAYGVERRRHYLRARGQAVVLTFGVLLLLVTAMALLVVGPMAAEFLLGRIDLPWLHLLLSSGVRWGVACGFMLLGTSVLYWRVPSRKPPCFWITPGSLFATAGWVAATKGMQLYIENFAKARYNETYGTLGGVVVLLFWLYMTGALLLTGGQINGIIHRAAVGEADDAGETSE